MAEIILHKSADRFHIQSERSDSFFTFSFGNLYREDRLGFGALRVLNDDIITPGAGFGSHPHDNMEIITIMVSGEIRHEDSLGNKGVALPGRLQIISAGTGIFHSEYNNSLDSYSNNLQIWLYPNRLNTPPRYQQAGYTWPTPLNRWQTILEPLPVAAQTNASTRGQIYQDAWFSMTRLEKGQTLSYQIKREGNGVYLFLIEGRITVLTSDAAGAEPSPTDSILERRDAMGIAGAQYITIVSEEPAEILLMDIPL